MQQTFKATVTNLLLAKLEAQDASDESSDMNESKHLDELLIFCTKQTMTLAETVRQRFLKVSSIKSLKCKLIHLSNFQNDALKNLFI